jgi:hypothetical protein
MTDDHNEALYAARAKFAQRYLDRKAGIYSVGIGREDGDFCVRISGTEDALARLPYEFDGIRVVHRIGAPGIACT